MAKRRTTSRPPRPRVPQVPPVSQIPGTQTSGTPYYAVQKPLTRPGGAELADGPGSYDPQTGLEWPSMTETGDPGRFSDFPQFGQMGRSGLLAYGTGFLPVGEGGASRVFNPDTISVAEYDMMGLDPTIRACLLGYALIMQTADLGVSCADPDMKALIESEFLHLLPRLLRETVRPGLQFGWADAEIIWENKYNVAVEVDRPAPPPPVPPAFPLPGPMMPPGGPTMPAQPGLPPSAGDGAMPPGSNAMPPGSSAMPLGTGAAPAIGGAAPASNGPLGSVPPLPPPPPAPGDVKNFRIYPYVTTVKDFVPLPNPSVVLRQTTGGELAGAVQYAYKQSFIPPSKLFHYATDSLFRNPYGTAMTKACYPFFYWTRFLYEMLMVCVERAGAPPVIGRYPANARLTVGSTVTGTPITEDAGVVMKQKLQNLRSFAVATFPRIFDEHGNDLYSIEELPLEAHIDWITTAIDLLNREKMKAMFFPDKILESGEVGSYALAKEHTDVFSLAVQSRLNEFLDSVNRGVLKQFVRFNDRRCPLATITYSQPNVEAMQGLMMAVVQAITTGTALVTQTQDQVLVPNWRKLADDLGIPYSVVRKTDGMDAMGNPLQPGMNPDQQDAQAAQAAQGGPGGQGGPGDQGGPGGVGGPGGAGPQPGVGGAPGQLSPDQLQPGAGAFQQPGQGPVQMGESLPLAGAKESGDKESGAAPPHYENVSYQGRAMDLPKVRALTGHDDIHALHRHFFGDMAGHVTGDYQLRPALPGGATLGFHGVTRGDNGEETGKITREFLGDISGHGRVPRTLNNVSLHLNHAQQGHGIATRLYAAQEKYARDTGAEAIKTYADVSTGPYAWARQGFDFDANQRAGYDSDSVGALGETPMDHYKAALHQAVAAQVRNGALTHAEGAAHEQRIGALKHSWDIAHFDTGVHVPLKTLDGKPGHLGKYVMTQRPFRQDYNAVKAITADASSPGERQAASLHVPTGGTA